ncbi:SfnB family sulfur acquisition oxidoreductase [Raineyella sp. LH-20]|uniref:SfnB family sulfur acquisition oxidoreductase n=1 Tax=Raineyella sp. LH-20 TaxID=3081204 RepID=UPI002954C77F|nr:SfnB family sulfur acquisition oxidoreductase [Raineyella sp. LH-20]WOP18086.1 SfnB family sulfur acquisition oxidoreductase [Raineyella sp. LH-20]
MTTTDIPPRTGQDAPTVPVLDADSARTIARGLAATYTDGAAHRDLHRELPATEIESLSASGLLALGVPTAFGGPGASAATVAEVLRILATADPNIAQIPHSHFVYLNLVRLAAPRDLQEEIFSAVLQGARLGNAQSELGGPTALSVTTRLSPDAAGGYRLTGRKGYATGALFATWIPVLAGLADTDEQVVAFVPRDAPGVTVIDDWDGIGQRTTASGQVHLEDVAVPAHRVISRARAVSGPYGYGAYAQLLHGAIDAGIAEGALAEAAAFVRTTARPHHEAAVARAVDDPLTIQRVGELEVRLRAATAQLRVAAEAVDAVQATPDEDLATEATLAVAALKILATEAALAAAEGGLEISGTRAAGRTYDYDRHWRNARTHTLHDPVRWKYQHLGRHRLTGERPPRTGTL